MNYVTLLIKEALLYTVLTRLFSCTSVFCPMMMQEEPSSDVNTGFLIWDISLPEL